VAGADAYNGSRHRIYKRYLTSAQLAEELGGEVLFEGQSFVAARVTWSNPSGRQTAQRTDLPRSARSCR
jgi:hypothetical protein